MVRNYKRLINCDPFGPLTHHCYRVCDEEWMFCDDDDMIAEELLESSCGCCGSRENCIDEVTSILTKMLFWRKTPKPQLEEFTGISQQSKHTHMIALVCNAL